MDIVNPSPPTPLHVLLQRISLVSVPECLACSATGTERICVRPIITPSTVAEMYRGSLLQSTFAKVQLLPTSSESTPNSSVVAVLISLHIVPPAASEIVILAETVSFALASQVAVSTTVT